MLVSFIAKIILRIFHNSGHEVCFSRREDRDAVWLEVTPDSYGLGIETPRVQNWIDEFILVSLRWITGEGGGITLVVILLRINGKTTQFLGLYQYGHPLLKEKYNIHELFQISYVKMYLGNQLKSWRKLFNVIFDNDKKMFKILDYDFWITLVFMFGKTMSFCLWGRLSWYWSMFSKIFIQRIPELHSIVDQIIRTLYNTWMVFALIGFQCFRFCLTWKFNLKL